jgi:uncharacterized protein (TIGR03118 family)
MTRRNWFQSQSKQPLGQRRRSRPRLELLEDRALLSGYQQRNLVGFQPGMAHYTDPLLNGWGLAFAPNGPFWVADTATGVSTVYDHQGKPQPLVVTVPGASGGTGSPTGVVYNPTSDFVISKNGKSAPALFIFDTTDGTISGWNPAVDPTHAIIMSSRPAAYFGLVLATNGSGQNVLYAADFANNSIDMFGGSYNFLGSFTDPKVTTQLPGYMAYGVQEVNGQLYVTFDSFGNAPFGGVVDIFDTNGNLLTPNHFTANAPGAGPLANPWGVVQAPPDFGIFSNDILIGNVEQNTGPSAASINAFNPSTGAFLGQLKEPDGVPLAIPGLWDLEFGAGSPQNGKTNELFFTAGPNAITFTGNGLFGMIHAAGDQGGGNAPVPPGSSGHGQSFGYALASAEPVLLSGLTAAISHSGTVTPGSESASPNLTARDAVSLSLLLDSSAARAPAQPAVVVSPHKLASGTMPSELLDQVFATLNASRL